MNERFIPANGSEGADFLDTWCRRCARDKAMRDGADFDECDDNELCQIIAASFRGEVAEWIYKDGEPTCTTFVPAGDKVPQVDTLTGDLFS